MTGQRTFRQYLVVTHDMGAALLQRELHAGIDAIYPVDVIASPRLQAVHKEPTEAPGCPVEFKDGPTRTAYQC